MSRKIARDAAMRMLYAYELTGELNQDMIQETIEPAALDAEDMKYLKQVTEGAVEQRASLDTLIEQKAVELAKKYSEPKSKQFINGILGSISRSKKKEEEEKSQ